MTSLRERLERKIELASYDYRGKDYNSTGACSQRGFEDGAKSLLPLVCELAEALGKAKGAMSYAYEDRSDQYYLNVKQDLEVALTKLRNLVDEP